MSTLASMPHSKTRQPLSPFGSGADAPEEPLVLIRLRDLNVREESTVDSAESSEERTSEPEEQEPRTSESTTEAVSGEVSAEIVKAPTPTAPTALPTEPATVDPAPSQTAEASVATPSRRQRQRRETPPTKRDWSHTIWQGTVGLLLVSMVIIVYFIMAGGGKKGTADPAETRNAEGHRSPDELETPEIWIPAPGKATQELSEADFPGKWKSLKRENTASETPAHAAPEKILETEEVAKERALPAAEGEASSEPANIREAARPRTEASSYPVTPAGATYPVTDPNRFRYPDDTRPSNSTARRPPASAEGRPAERASQWNENERIGGSAGGEFQPATKLR